MKRWAELVLTVVSAWIHSEGANRKNATHFTIGQTKIALVANREKGAAASRSAWRDKE
ncbi:MAG: hypothetical protein Q4A17_05955 [Thermoguttaceae bacterium]|nr:hypothetical protein [Thermoguttaceae bacterium]